MDIGNRFANPRLVNDPRELVHIGDLYGHPLWIELYGDPEIKKRDYVLAKETLFRMANRYGGRYDPGQFSSGEDNDEISPSAPEGTQANKDE